MRATAIIAALALAGALFLAACGGEDVADPGGEDAADPVAEMPAEHTSPPADERAPADPAPAREVTVELGEWFFESDRHEVKAGEVAVNARNVGAIEHDLVSVRTDRPADRLPTTPEGAPDIDKDASEVHVHVDPGEVERVHATFAPGRYALVCTFPAHYEAGQHASLTVVP